MKVYPRVCPQSGVLGPSRVGHQAGRDGIITRSPGDTDDMRIGSQSPTCSVVPAAHTLTRSIAVVGHFDDDHETHERKRIMVHRKGRKV